ncbi:uroporphyrinogen-III C-methyltransferase [Thalassotalea mangrovi]|uniref:Heme biosynthesis operon protein HemX n=1 Tax=Thalassotalea mangrovi TaxID=2572245 RepID=A0A4U1B548_9GAMM|nr:uroporphyrinogen-III C-methyltransferase [Thalassotalea mangrovi]TKB45533.1 hypothetical protein E8M12_07990 [Thalassotalea mangrovi]
MTDKDKKSEQSSDQNKDSQPAANTADKSDNAGADSSSATSEKQTATSSASAAKIAARAKARAGHPDTVPGKSSATGNSTRRADSDKKPGISKVGVLALLLALIAAGGTGALYYYQQQQLQALANDLNENLKNAQQSNNQSLSQRVTEQLDGFQKSSQQSNQALSEELRSRNEQAQQALMDEVEQLNAKISRLTSQQPSNWRVYEAEYLLRMASRVIWLENDVTTALSLLDDADARLASMKQAQFMPIRKLIRQDKQTLQQLPEDKSQEIILALLALSESTEKLVLKGTERQVEVAPQEQQLSEDIADWERNLRISWQRFLADFITVRNKHDKDEPLMEPQYQQNMMQNLQLKLQISQWAVTQKHTQLYQQSLTDIEQWLQRYFAENNRANQAFIDEISRLQEQEFDIDYPQNLQSQQALRELLDQNFSASTRPFSHFDSTVSSIESPAMIATTLVVDSADTQSKQSESEQVDATADGEETQ